MKFLLFLCLSFAFAFSNIYEKLSDFAYEKKPNKDIKLQESRVLSVQDKGKDCVELLITKDKVRILQVFDACQNLQKDQNFKDFLESDFLKLYQDDKEFIMTHLKSLQRIMQDLMLYYKLHFSFSNELEKMSKNPNLSILKLDEKEGGTLLFHVDNEACVSIELARTTGKMAMRIQGIENLNKECKIFIHSPAFKQLSFTKKDFIIYALE